MTLMYKVFRCKQAGSGPPFFGPIEMLLIGTFSTLNSAYELLKEQARVKDIWYELREVYI